MSGLVLSVAPSERRLPPAINKTPQTIKDMYFIIKKTGKILTNDVTLDYQPQHGKCFPLPKPEWQDLPEIRIRVAKGVRGQ